MGAGAQSFMLGGVQKEGLNLDRGDTWTEVGMQTKEDTHTKVGTKFNVYGPYRLYGRTNRVTWLVVIGDHARRGV